MDSPPSLSDSKQHRSRATVLTLASPWRSPGQNHDLDDGHAHAFTIKLCIRALLAYLNHAKADKGSLSYTAGQEEEDIALTGEEGYEESVAGSTSRCRLWRRSR